MFYGWRQRGNVGHLLPLRGTRALPPRGRSTRRRELRSVRAVRPWGQRMRRHAGRRRQRATRLVSSSACVACAAGFANAGDSVPAATRTLPQLLPRVRSRMVRGGVVSRRGARRRLRDSKKAVSRPPSRVRARRHQRDGRVPFAKMQLDSELGACDATVAASVRAPAPRGCVYDVGGRPPRASPRRRRRWTRSRDDLGRGRDASRRLRVGRGCRRVVRGVHLPPPPGLATPPAPAPPVPPSEGSGRSARAWMLTMAFACALALAAVAR